jgi:hypothetical protein
MRLINTLLTLPIIILLLGAAGCTRDLASIQQMEQLPPQEAFVFGKLRVLINGKDATPYSNLMFKQGRHTIGGTVKQLVTNDGIICAGLPAGDNYFWHLLSNRGPFSKQYEYSFAPTDATLRLPEAGGFYYIGDITIDWTPTKTATDRAAAFISGAIIGGGLGGIVCLGIMPYSSGDAIITVRDNLAEDQKLFQERFHTDKILVPAFLEIKATKQPESSSSH